MRNRKLRVTSLLLALVMSAGLLAGCSSDGSSGNNSSSGEGGAAKDSITIATMGETPSLSPTEHNAVAGDYMNLLTYNKLFKSDMDMNPVPDLVDSYENISDTEWQFKIKQGVKFHDGSEMTVEDVKASLEWAQGFAPSLVSPSVCSPHGSFLHYGGAYCTKSSSFFVFALHVCYTVFI